MLCCLFSVYPLLGILDISVKEGFRFFTGAFASYGAGNFATVLSDRDFWRAMGLTAGYCALVTIVSTVVSVCVTYLLHRDARVRRLFQSVLFLPIITSLTAIGLTWRFMFNDTFGLVNRVIIALGGTGVDWLTSSGGSWMLLVLFGIWSAVPTSVLMLVSAVQQMDGRWGVTALIDGVSESRFFAKVTLPVIAPRIALVVLFNAIDSARVFGELFPLFNGRPGPVYNLVTAVYYLYDLMFGRGEYGLAAAAAVIFIGVFSLAIVVGFALFKRLRPSW